VYVVGEAQNAFHTEQDDHENEENCRFVAEELEHLLAMNKAPSSVPTYFVPSSQDVPEEEEEHSEGEHIGGSGRLNEYRRASGRRKFVGCGFLG
jgi:hypothetical protein